MVHLHYRISTRTEKGAEKLFQEIMSDNFSNLEKKTDFRVLETQTVPNKINPKRPTPRDIIAKISKPKERIMKAVRQKQLVIYKRITAAKILYTRRSAMIFSKS